MASKKLQAVEAYAADPTDSTSARRRATLERMASKTLITDVRKITPEEATDLLDTNLKNRPISDRRVKLYAEEMKAGRWKVNHQGLAFGQDGILHDGQHRLWAVITADVPVEFMVTRGQPEEVRVTIDKGKARHVGDELTMFEGIKEGRRLFTLCRGVSAILDGVDIESQGAALDLYHRFQADFDHALVNWPYRKRSMAALAPVSSALVFAWRTAPDRVDSFWQGLHSGEGLEAGSPILTLRRWFEVNPSAKHNSRQAFRDISFRTLRCLIAYLENEAYPKMGAVAPDTVLYFCRAHGIKEIGGVSTTKKSQIEHHIRRKREGKE
jgi:hypothetical protein